MTLPSNFIGIDGSVGSSYIPPLYSDIPLIKTSSTNYTPTNWKLADAMRCSEVTNFPTVTGPNIPSYTPSVDKNMHIGHYGYLQTLHGETVKFGDWYVMWSTSVEFPASDSNSSGVSTWSNMDTEGFIAYWYSADGVNWTYGNVLLTVTQPTGSSFQCTSMVIREGTENIVDVFFTVRTPGTETLFSIQSSTGKIGSSTTGIIMTGFSSMTTMFEPDGTLYATFSQDSYNVFAWPKVFVNPYDGNIYCIFSGHMGNGASTTPLTQTETGILSPGVTTSDDGLVGCVGIASMEKEDYINGVFNNWTLMNPIITSHGTVDSMERPSIVFSEGITYIMVNCYGSSTHFNSLVSSKTGAYGFYSENGLFGPYYPLNWSGEMIVNNTTQDYNTGSYGYFIDQDGYAGYFTGSPADSTSLSRITVSCGQTLKVNFNKGNSYITNIYAYGRCISTRDWLTDIWEVTRGNSAPWILDGEVKS